VQAREHALQNIRAGKPPDYTPPSATEIQDPRPWDSPEKQQDRIDAIRAQRSLS
jgi:hypothetical protein